MIWRGDGTGAIACAGNWIVDIVHDIDAWPRRSDLVHIRDERTGVGGGAANVVLDLAAFDAGLTLLGVGLIGRDLHADTVRQTCDRAGVDTRWLAATDAAPTGHTHVMNVPGDSRTFFYHPGANDLLDACHVPVEALAASGARILYLGYLNLLGAMDRLDADGGTAAARVLARARAAGMLTCVDLVSTDTPGFRAVVAASLPQTDVLFLNEVEAARAAGLPLFGPADRAGFAAAAQALVAGGAGTVILHSEALSLWQARDAGAVWAVPDPVDPARIASAVGAGDAFCAGAVHGIHQGWPPDAALRLAHRAAAACLTGLTATDGLRPLRDLMRD